MEINVIDYKPLVVSIARKRYNFFRMYSASITLNDCVQSGFLGLCKASKKFDSNKNKTFGSFSKWFIKSEIMDYILKDISIVKISIKKIIRKVKSYIDDNGLSIDTLSLSKELNVSESMITNIISLLLGKNINKDLIKDNRKIEDIKNTYNIDYDIDIQRNIKNSLNKIETDIVEFKYIYGINNKDIKMMLKIDQNNFNIILNQAKKKLSKCKCLELLYSNLY